MAALVFFPASTPARIVSAGFFVRRPIRSAKCFLEYIAYAHSDNPLTILKHCKLLSTVIDKISMFFRWRRVSLQTPVNYKQNARGIKPGA